MRFRAKKTKDYHLSVKVRTSFGEAVDQQTLESFALKNITGSFKPVRIRKRYVKYVGILGIPLSEYLKEPISKYEFLLMMERLLLAGRYLRDNGFSADDVASDLSHVYINKMTKEIQLIYLPLSGKHRQNAFMELVQTVVYAVTSSEGDTGYLSRYINFLRNLQSLDTENIEKLENYIANEKQSVASFPDGGCGSTAPAGRQQGNEEDFYTYSKTDSWANPDPDTEIVNEERRPPDEKAAPNEYRPFNEKIAPNEYRLFGEKAVLNEYRPSGEKAVLNEYRLSNEKDALYEQPTVYDGDGCRSVSGIPYREVDDSTMLPEEDGYGDNSATLLEEDDDTAYDDRTILLDVDGNDDGFPNMEDETDFLEPVREIPRMPVLYRISTGETVQITKKVFRLGKDESCVDYAIPDNHAVSRSHADIICREKQYYVFDLGSKNKTYINNRALPSQYEVEINNGDTLKVANEEFEFRW